jgi:hypothetical protein
VGLNEEKRKPTLKDVDTAIEKKKKEPNRDEVLLRRVRVQL